MDPVTSAVITGYYSVTRSNGDIDGYAHITCNFQAIDKTDVYYRVLYHLVGDPDTLYWFHSDFPWERWYFGVKIKIAALASGGVTYSPPTRQVDVIKIQTRNINNESDFAEFSIVTPIALGPTHETPHDFIFNTGGDIGDARGFVTLHWQDITKFVSGGRITLTKYGVTSVGDKVTLYDQGFSSMPLTLSPDYSQPNFIQIGFPLLPPGITLPDPPVWSGASPPQVDPAAPTWVVEGDVLTLTVYIYNNDTNASAATTTATFNFHFYHTARFYQFVDSATRGQPYRHQLEIIQDPWVPIPIQGTFALGSVVPPIDTWSLTTDGILTCTNPTHIGGNTLNVRLVSRGNAASVEPLFLIINIEGTPVIQAPPQTIPLTLGSPYPQAFNPYATNHPTHWSISAPLPHGLSLDANTGAITGYPDVVIPTSSPLLITFFATNAVGVSIGWLTSWTVTFFAPPNITSPNTLTVYLEESTPYQITTDQPALAWRAPDGLPAGLKFYGSTITGIPTGLLGVYVVGLQAANRWGWSPVFQLTVTIAVAPPVIYSPLSVQTFVDEPFSYPILASHTPFSYGASPLPPGLALNSSLGIISGTPVNPMVGSSTNAIHLTATNGGGTSDTADLQLTVLLPPIPVIDTSITHGRAITSDTGGDRKEFLFPASHSPSRWSSTALPAGMNLELVPDEIGGGFSARIAGVFQLGGLYQVQLTAYNRGGASVAAPIAFLITISPVQAQTINLLGTVMEIWIDLNSAAVGIGNKSTIVNDRPVPPTGTVLTIKRGDTVDLRIVFHEDGVPVQVNLNSLKFGIKPTFDDEFIIFTDTYNTLQGAGRFSINPDFSGTNDDLDAVLVGVTTDLKGEIQWEMTTETGVIVRRSSQIFNVSILRDLIHPD